MKTYRRLWPRLCSKANLWRAYENARRHKTTTTAVQAFDEHATYHLAILRHELLTRTYRPRPLRTFVLRDPKTRVISRSAFRDRVVHHALVNVLQPIFEPRFIHDSYASRSGKGTLAAVRRYDEFSRKVTRNGNLLNNARNANDVAGYALKCDIKQYFDTVDHDILVRIIARRVHDQDVIALVRTILANHHSGKPCKGMPLGNWTSQFFANIYLNELDEFVKHRLRAKYYLRYLDDFIILDRSKRRLEDHLRAIDGHLRTLTLELHPNKCTIIPLARGVPFLGYRIWYHHKLLRKRNIRTIKRRLSELLDTCADGNIDHESVMNTLQGWNAYANHANTHHHRQHLTEDVINALTCRNTSADSHKCP